jgi:hypothetical protein
MPLDNEMWHPAPAQMLAHRKPCLAASNYKRLDFFK